jgi:hypothetical protein
VRELRERLGINRVNSADDQPEMISADEAAHRLGIAIGSLHRLIRKGILPASQALPSAPWQIPAAALNSEAVRIGVREIVARRPRNFKKMQENKTLRLPGL